MKGPLRLTKYDKSTIHKINVILRRGWWKKPRRLFPRLNLKAGGEE